MGILRVTFQRRENYATFPGRGKGEQTPRFDPRKDFSDGERAAGGSQDFQGSFFDGHVEGYRGFGLRARPRVSPT